MKEGSLPTVPKSSESYIEYEGKLTKTNNKGLNYSSNLLELLTLTFVDLFLTQL